MNDQDVLDELLYFLHDCDEEIQEDMRSVQTFKEAGILSGDLGLVITMCDGSVYHLILKKNN